MPNDKKTASIKLTDQESQLLRDFVKKVGGREQAKAVLETWKKLQKAA